jgi:hypothetical protein
VFLEKPKNLVVYDCGLLHHLIPHQRLQYIEIMETGLEARGLELFHMFSGKELYYKYPHGDEVYNVVAANVCTDYDGFLKEVGIEVQELRFFIMKKCHTSFLLQTDTIVKRNNSYLFLLAPARH